MAIRKGQRTLPKGTEAHRKTYNPPKVTSRSSIPNQSHRAVPGHKKGKK